MYPTLVKFGSISVSSFSVLVLTAFLFAYYLFEKEIIRRGKDRSLADLMLLASVIGGLGGAKILFLYQNATLTQVLDDPLRYLSSGYTFLGGLIGSLILVYVVSIFKKVKFWDLTDYASAPLVIAYGIGRIGCLLVGDDYGVPTNLPWGISFPKGAPPTIQEVHPTQIYDTLCMIVLFFFLWNYLRKKNMPSGWLSAITFICLGMQRFLIEFIRNTTPSFIEGISQAQLISLFLVFVGIVKLIELTLKPKLSGS